MKTFENKTLLKDINVLFVCMGNICRSPTAHGVFQNLVFNESLQKYISVDSAGTYAYHAGEEPDPRARDAAAKRGYDLSNIKARKVEASDILEFDYILAMDRENMQDLYELCEKHQRKKIRLFLDFAKGTRIKEVPDPYFGGLNGFDTVLDLVEEASKGLLEYIRVKHSLTR